jgi:hypothetical protein
MDCIPLYIDHIMDYDYFSFNFLLAYLVHVPLCKVT